MNIELRNIAHNKGLSQETIAFAADVYVDGKKAGNAVNNGHGGMTMVHIDDAMTFKRVKEYVRSLDSVDLGEGLGTTPMTLELFIDIQLEKQLNEKHAIAQKKRWCKNEVVYRLKGDTPNTYRTLKFDNGTFSQRQREWMQKTYGDQIEEIVNDTLAK